jgi:superfamily II DNA or RNA helicase
MSHVIISGQEPAADRVTDDGTVAALRDAMAVISSVCDYAESRDAQGFNAADTWLGHVLAQMPAGLWPDDAALAAWDMLRKYRAQLAGAGIDYDRLPRPPGAGELEAARREKARERARERARQWRGQQYRQARSYLRCDGEGEQVTLAFPYEPGLVDACRAIPGRRWDGAAKANVFPFASLPRVVELACAHGIEVTAEVRALAAVAAGQTAPPQVRLDERDGTVVIDAPFDPGLNQALKDANGGRATWDRNARVHRLPVRAAGELPALADRFGLRVSGQARAAIAAERERQDRNRAMASAFEAGPVPVPGLAGGMALKPQQYPVVRFALQHRRVLIGDDMGWGKTVSSLAAAAADGAWPAVVVCRPSLTLNWAAEITRFFPALAVYQASGVTPQPVPPGTDVIIIGSAALAAKPRGTGDGGTEFGWVKTLAAAGPKALIIDEGQDTKERSANRSRACEQLAAAVIARDGLVLDLTGTAILNRPRELCQQLSILGRIGEFGGPKAFLWRYCLSETNQWGASYNGARNLIELHDRLRAWGIMIRRADDAALGLPPCREHVLRIPEAGLDQAAMDRYRQAEADLLGYLAEQARTTAQRLGENPASAAVQAVIRARAAEHLVAINTLRQLAGQAKRGYVTAWVRERVAAGEKVMIAAHHRDQVDAYAAEFGGLKLQGGQPVAEKEAAKAAFQQRPAAEAPVIAVAIGAGGVGHTLTAAKVGIQAEQAWTPGETQQMKKRLHRIGQDRPVDYYITVAEGTIDEHLWAVVTGKQATLDAVLDGRSDEGAADDEASVAAELTWRLTRQGLAASHAPAGRGRDRGDGGQAVPPGPGAPGASARERGRTRAAGTCTVCGTAMTVIEPGQDAHPLCAADPAAAKAAAARPAYGERDEITIRHWRQAHIDPEKVRAWCRDTGRDEPPARGALPADLVAGYLAERGATDIPMPDPPDRAGWLARRPVLRRAVTVELGWKNGPSEPFTVVYGPCPRCSGPTCALPGQPLPLCLDCAAHGTGHGDAARGAGPPPGGAPPAGDGNGRAGTPPAPSRGGDGDGDQAQAEAGISGRRIRESAHRYLDEGLWPVPAWGITGNGECRCPKGADCPRPGKHPRSARAGPREWSWKPLACHTHDEIEQRFAPGAGYADGNLMVAIPPGMMAIDRDDDDGGRAALATLAGELGELPPTLAHRTPHGEHLIYRTPPGWTGRAWVGKDPGNPVPAGIDLRMPGQLLMAPPSAVPGPHGPARYGPASRHRAAALPGAYLTAWTPPRPPPRPPSPPAPIPPDSAGRAARYVHDAMTRIAGDLAGRKPGGRNAAAYEAGLKAGSLLGAARSTPGAEQAAAAWTDEAAEEALLDAARRNGYVGKDGEAEARRAIQSGLRNGLRSPRALPGFTTSGAAPAARRRQRPAAPRPDQPPPAPAPRATRRRPGRWQDTVPAEIRREIGAGGPWAAGTDAHREQPAAGTGAARHDSPRMQANRAAVAANQAYRAGDLDQARQLTDLAAALDPSREQLWQRHRQQIAARQLIITARAARAEGDRKRAGKLLADARQLDPRMPALWDGDLPATPAVPPASRTRGRDMAVHGPGGAGGPGASPAREAAREHHGPAAAAEPDGDPAARWPAPDPRVTRRPASPGRQAGAGDTGQPEPGGSQQPGAAPAAAASREAGQGTPAAAGSDWRDQIIAGARQRWQSGPSWPGNPALHPAPGAGTPEPGIEPGT